jgi:orotate phosphoribosyltransferase
VTQADALRLLAESDALLTGHFKLSSGLHSDRYLQCAKVLQWPERAAALGAALGALLSAHRPTVVLSPAMGGLIIGHEVGRALGMRAIFAERVEGAFTLRRGFALEPGDRVAVVEDVVTTGKSTREVLALVKHGGAVPVVCGAIVDRRGKELAAEGPSLDGVPLATVIRVEVDAWPEPSCPLCAAGVPIVSPGSRHLAGKSPG